MSDDTALIVLAIFAVLVVAGILVVTLTANIVIDTGPPPAVCSVDAGSLSRCGG